MQIILNYIDGKLIEPINCQYIDNFEPATGQVYSQVPDSDLGLLGKKNKTVLYRQNAISH